MRSREEKEAYNRARYIFPHQERSFHESRSYYICSGLPSTEVHGSKLLSCWSGMIARGSNNSVRGSKGNRLGRTKARSPPTSLAHFSSFRYVSVRSFVGPLISKIYILPPYPGIPSLVPPESNKLNLLPGPSFFFFPVPYMKATLLFFRAQLS